MKKVIALAAALMLVIFFSGCSKDEEKISALEKELDLVNTRLEEKEEELKNSKIENAGENDSILIPKDKLPRLWQDGDAQLWEYVTDFSIAKENGWNRGVTNWRTWEEEIPPTLAAPNEMWDNPGSLMNAWVAETDFIKMLGTDLWESTMRVVSANENLSEGYILNYGLQDDSIAGIEIKMTMIKDEENWHIDKVEVRNRCARNVTEDKESCV